MAVQRTAKKGITDLSEVILASLNTEGVLYIDKKEDKMGNMQKVED